MYSRIRAIETIRLRNENIAPPARIHFIKNIRGQGVNQDLPQAQSSIVSDKRKGSVVSKPAVAFPIVNERRND